MSLLPDGYKRLLCIESTGTQYVDTGLKPNQDTRVTAVAELESVAAEVIFGTRSANYNFYIQAYTGNVARVGYGTTATVTTLAVNTNVKCEFELNKNVVSVGENSYSFSNQTFTEENNLYLLGLNNRGTFGSGALAKLYSCRIYDNDTLVRNFIPCENESGVVGLYDTVNSVFYTDAAGGTFTAGPEWGLIELEYIESSGSQYIDTGFKPNQDSAYEVSFFAEEDKTYISVMGAEDALKSNSFALWTNHATFATNIILSAGWNDGTETVAIRFDKGTIYKDDVESWSASGTFQCSYNCTLFGVNRANNLQDKPSSMRMYFAKIYDNDTLIRDFIPAKLSDGTVGLYDKVEGVFYSDAAGGTFTAGPELYGNDDYTIFLLHGDAFEDASIAKRNVVNNGTVIANQGKFGESSFQFNGAASIYFDPLDFAGDDFTVDWWEYVTSASSEARFATAYTTESASAGGMVAGYNGTALYASSTFNNKWELISGEAMFSNTVEQWVHWALVRHGTALTSYRNGVEFASTTISGEIVFSSAYNSVIGDYRAGDHSYFIGYIDEFRVSNIARYTSDFAVQTAEYSVYHEESPLEPPAPPETVLAPYADFANTLLMWSMVPGADGYNITRDGELIASTPYPFYHDGGLEMQTEYVYNITAYNEAGESEAIAVTASTTEFKLITDRTAADVQTVLAGGGDWLSGLKGAYNATDLNRVEKAVGYVTERLKIAGWYILPETKLDWSFSDFPTASEMQRYLDNIRLLHSTLPTGLPAVPADMNLFYYTEANAIEQILMMLDAAVTNIMLNTYYSSEIYSGEVQ